MPRQWTRERWPVLLVGLRSRHADWLNTSRIRNAHRAHSAPGPPFRTQKADQMEKCPACGQNFTDCIPSRCRAKPVAKQPSSPQPQTVNQTISCDVDLPTDRFWIRDQNRDEAQVRLEENGNVYLCYTADNRRVIESRVVSWPEFLAAFRKFVNSFPPR